MKILITSLCLLSLAVSGCVSPDTESRHRDYIPRVFEAHIGGFSGPSYTVTFIPPSTLRYTESEGFRGLKSTEYQIPAEYWEVVYERLQDAGVFQWRTSYVREGFQDGTQWSLEYDFNGKKKKIWGDNRYPDYGEFKTFLSIVSDLSSGKKFE